MQVIQGAKKDTVQANACGTKSTVDNAAPDRKRAAEATPQRRQRNEIIGAHMINFLLCVRRVCESTNEHFPCFLGFDTIKRMDN